MFYHLRSVLSPAELTAIREELGKLRFRDGGATAGVYAQGAKRNEQGDPADPAYGAIVSLGRDRLGQSAEFRLAARLRRFGPVMISRYTDGMSYGAHVDNALMTDGGGNPVRSDLSFTLFLSDPDDYQGGELEIDVGAALPAVRLPAGDAILYPSSTLHRVRPISRGARYAIVGWVESMVRDPARRALLYDLDTACAGLFQKHGASAELDRLTLVAANLSRLWIEP